ncbi:MAG: U32 family peptidase C-terminal domain-containing protein [Patescibacteria group bacterium]
MGKNAIKKPELLAPAGNLEKMKTAFAFGADAVYLGIPDFSLRVRINDFTVNDIKKAISCAHKINKKVYVTVNIFARNKHLIKLPTYIKKLKILKPDGLFISDPGIMKEIKKIWPKANIILSTQANCTNWQAAKFWQNQGISRIILARELALTEIKEIKKKIPDLELECFVHGALCMAYSGRCFLSKLYNEREANLGDCSQPCRWRYKMKNEKLKVKSNRSYIQAEPHEEILELVEEGHGSYILNSKDLCLIKRLPELIDAGIDAFKIEGRAKSVYYLANVVGAYRKAIDLITTNSEQRTANTKKQLGFLYNELEQKLYHRGFTEGFMFNKGEQAQNLKNSHNIPKWEFCGQAMHLNLQMICKSTNKVCVKVHNTMKAGDRIEILRPDYDIIKMKIKEMRHAKTGEIINEAHGGAGGDVVLIEVDKEVPEYSVIRRVIK